MDDKSKMEYEIRRVGHYFSLKCSFFCMAAVLLIGYAVGKSLDYRTDVPILMMLVLLFLPSLLTLLQKKPSETESFILTTLRDKYSYNGDRYKYRSIIFLLMMAMLLIWHFVLKKNISIISVLPVITIITGCSARIISYILFVLIIKRKLMRGSI